MFIHILCDLKMFCVLNRKKIKIKMNNTYRCGRNQVYRVQQTNLCIRLNKRNPNNINKIRRKNPGTYRSHNFQFNTPRERREKKSNNNVTLFLEIYILLDSRKIYSMIRTSHFSHFLKCFWYSMLGVVYWLILYNGFKWFFFFWFCVVFFLFILKWFVVEFLC